MQEGFALPGDLGPTRAPLGAILGQAGLGGLQRHDQLVRLRWRAHEVHYLAGRGLRRRSGLGKAAQQDDLA